MFDCGEESRAEIPFAVFTSRFIVSPSTLISSMTMSFFARASESVMSASITASLNAIALHCLKSGGLAMKKLLTCTFWSEMPSDTDDTPALIPVPAVIVLSA